MNHDSLYRRQAAVSFRAPTIGAAEDITNNVINHINDGRDGLVSASITRNGDGVSLLIVYEVWSSGWEPWEPYQFDTDGVLIEGA
jgi:hypothetical protein